MNYRFIKVESERKNLSKSCKMQILVRMLLLCALCFLGAIQVSAVETRNVVTSAKKVSKGTWIKQAKDKKYRYSNGSYAQNEWLRIKGKLYYFNSKGICETGWIVYKGNSYYAASNGQVLVKKWLTQKGSRYYFQSDGVCAKDKWLTISKKQYFFLADGKQAKSRMITYKNNTYYVNKNGTKVKGSWVKIKDALYYFDKNGVCIQNRWYKLGKEYRYLGSDGKMVTNSWIGNYYVDKNGIRLKNCVKDEYYLNSSGKKMVEVFRGNYIFLGDSRMVEMQASKAPVNTKYIAERGKGYHWLKKEGGITLQYYLKANPKVKVVLALGVNDLENINKYISYYKTLIKKYPKTKFYVLSVNPVDETPGKRYSKYVKNSEIQSFNKKLKKKFLSCYVDSNSYMWKKGFDTLDGLHYTAAVYQDLYDFLMREIK